MASSRHHNVYIDGAAYFWTSSVVGFVPVLRSRTIAMLLLAVWEEGSQKDGVKFLGYVIMPNHIHILVWAEKAENVKKFLARTLSRSSDRIISATRAAAERGSALAASWLRVFQSKSGSGARAALWKERGRAFPITNGEGFRQKLNYIHGNPVRWELVEYAEDWEFSSASWYSRGQGPLTMDAVDVR